MVSNLLDSEGKLMTEGWQLNQPGVDNHVKINQVEARSHFFNNQYLSSFMTRNINYMFFTAGDLEI
jgi:hypothetical protein